MVKKAIFISRKFDLKGDSAPSRYFLDVLKKIESLGYDITLVKLDFKAYRKKKSISTDLSYKVVLPGFKSFFGQLISLHYIFFYKWAYKIGYNSKFRTDKELLSDRERRFLKSISKMKHDAVFVDYFFLAESLKLFSGLKTIITHDVWHQHYSVGKNHSYFGLLTAEEEKRLLNMADLVVAISKRDRQIFESLQLTGTKVIDLYPVIKLKRTINKDHINKKINSNAIIFVGSNYRPNVYGLEWFLDNVWPLLDVNKNNIQLKVIGNVKKYIDPKFLVYDENIEFLGFVDDLSRYYDKAKLAITPLLEGSGVKIKSIEAIDFGLPVISTSVGTQGLTHFVGSGIMTEDTPGSFAKRIIDLFKNSTGLENQLNSLKKAREITVEEQKDNSELKTFLN